MLFFILNCSFRGTGGQQIIYNMKNYFLFSVMVLMTLCVGMVKADENMPYKDPTLTFEERAADLVSRMTLAEKQNQMGNDAKAIPRLNVRAYNYWSEAVHGVAHNREATSFPVSFSMASSWNVALMQQIATAISNEARGYADKSNEPLSYWSPTINMSRDPRWGRNEESYGEDPFLTASMAGRFVSGMQGTQDNYTNPHTGEQYLKTMSIVKHYAANNSEFNRHNGNSVMDNRTLRNYYTGRSWI